MRRCLRLALVLLLSLALPLQGVMAAVMPLVGMQHGSATAMADDCHGHAQVSAGADAHGEGKTAPARVKACNACCPGLCAPDTALRSLPPQPQQGWQLHALPAPEGVTPARLERPPIHLS